MPARTSTSFRLLACLLISASAARAQEPPAPDALARALDAMGIGESDLGYRPLAHWARYPHPRTTPHVLPFFEDLLAHPPSEKIHRFLTRGEGEAESGR